jgi:hypothetical protein
VSAPRLAVDAAAVTQLIADVAGPLLDELATAYANDPAAVGRLLALHARHVTALDVAVVDDDASDADRAIRAAEADGSRWAVCDLLPPAGLLDVDLSALALDTLANLRTKDAR